MPKFSMTKEKFKNQWLRHFAPGLTKKLYEEFINDRCIWHVFSFELINCEGLLMGNDARKAFDQADKGECICCDLFDSGGVTVKLPSKFDTSAKIDQAVSEFYVMAKDHSWTYIKTHEGDLAGPYFLSV